MSSATETAAPQRARVAAATVATVALVAAWEVLAQLAQARAVPTDDEWQQVRAHVAARRREGELVTAAPLWSDPLVRQHLGEFVSLADAARPDASRYASALLVSQRGAAHPDLAGWTREASTPFRTLTVERWRNPRPASVRFDFVHALRDNRGVTVAHGREGGEQPCEYRSGLPVQGGGLGQGALAGPERFVCGGWAWVGRTVLEDLEHRGRLCIFAEPPPNGQVRVRFAGVTLGDELRGYHAVAYEAERGGDRYETGEPVTLRALVGDALVGEAVHEDGEGWKPFRFALGARAGTTADVEFVVRAPAPRDERHRQPRHYCFQADTR